MMLNMFITFFTSRIVLKYLGVEDYGLYGVVGGIISILGFINGSMSSATSRFLTFELGRGNQESLKKTFSAALSIHIIISILVLLLGESIGLWWLENKLVVPLERMEAARWVYQISIFSAILNITQVPFNALIISHEKMNVYAGVEILNSVLKLAVAFIISYSNHDHLIVYAILLFVVSVIITSLYKWYCSSHFEETNIDLFSKDDNIFKSLLSFSGWELFGNIANVAKSQGSNILLNLFFGVALNAAYTLANQVYGAVGQFVNGFQMAVTPQITKCYAAGDTKRFFSLVYKGCKYSLLIILVPLVPILFNIDYVLTLWLGSIPPYTSPFVILILIDTIITSCSGPLVVASKAIGNIKYYQIVIGFVLFINIPFIYLCFYLDENPLWLFIVRIFLSIIATTYRIVYLKWKANMSICNFLQYVLGRLAYPCIVISVVCVAIYITVGEATNIFVFLYESVALVAVTTFSVFFLGLSSRERKIFISKLYHK